MAHTFKVKPVKTYDQARYPSQYLDEEISDEEGRVPVGLWQAFVMSLLMLGLAFGFVGCFADYKTDPCTLSEQQSGSCGPDPDPDPDPDPLCPANSMECRAGDVLALCAEDGESWSTQACEDYCNDMYGIDAYTQGCDAQAQDPCNCEYDIIDGDIAECTPGDFYCVDDQTVSVCIEGPWNWQEQNCNDYCQETLGYDYHSYGCDSQAEEPCDCQYDVLDGMIAECEPGQFYCLDEETIMVCADDRFTWDDKTCALVCEEDYGEDYYTSGCDSSDVDNPCSCEYGIVDGGPHEP